MGIKLNKTGYTVTANNFIDDSTGLGNEVYPFKKVTTNGVTSYIVEVAEIIENDDNSITYDKENKKLYCKEIIEE